MIKNKEILAERLKGIKVNGEDITLEKLSAYLTDDKTEVELAAETLHILNDTQLNELKTTVNKTGYEQGKLVGSEMQMKRLKEITGLEIEGYKDPEKFMSSFKDKVLADAKIEPEKKVKELSESLATLQQTLQQKESEWNGLIQQKDQTIKSIKSEAILLQSMPKVEGYKTNHLLAAFRSDGFGIDIDENNNVVPVLNGKPLKDQYEKPLPLDKVFSDWMTNSGFTAAPGGGGRGAGNAFPQSGSQFKTESDMFKHMEQNKIDPTSPQGKEMIDKFYADKK